MNENLSWNTYKLCSIEMLMIRLNAFNMIGALVRKNEFVKCSFYKFAYVYYF